MKYKLLNDSQKGILIDRTPTLADVKDTIRVSFLIEGDCPHIAIFTDSFGIEHRKVIEDGKCRIPSDLLKKEQYVDLKVCRLDGEQITKAWQCEPIKISALMHLRRNQWQISGGMTDKDCYKRLNEIEDVHNKTLGEFNELREFIERFVSVMKTDFIAFTDKTNLTVQTLRQELNTAKIVTDSLKRDNETLMQNYNKAKEIIGNGD